jgi:hypothetical protein
MRIRRIAATAFRCIDSADVHLERGLNVLYAVNDHGKSTLALALRAAFLLPPGSADAENFLSWFDSQPPSVQIVFEDDEEKTWRVSKTFGNAGKAELDFSKDGTTFTRDCNARQVEEKLRQILGWGIPPPGGRRGPHGFPTSFLSQVLLAEQTNVAEVLKRTLEDDPDESGRARLTKALKGFAQDPLFKHVLERAQAECDLHYTAAGQRRRGKTSPFAQAAEETRRYAEQLAEKERKLQDSQAAEAAARRLSEQLAELLEIRETLREHARSVREANDRQKRVDAARQLTEQARLMVEQIQSDCQKVEAKAAEVVQLHVVLASCEIETNRVIGKHAEAAEAKRQAEEAYRLATSRNAARQRELLQAQLERKRAEVASNIQQARDRRERAAAALAAQQAFEQMEQSYRNRAGLLERLRAVHTDLRQARALAQERLLFADAVVAFARWRAASDAAESAHQRRQEASDLRQEAERLKERAAEDRAYVASASLPNAEKLATLLDLQKRMDLAEAALGGGLSLVVEPRKPLPMQILADGVPVSGVASSDAMEVEATRTIEMSINDLLDLRVVAGDANSRREAAQLRTEWTHDVSPVLALAKVATLAELQEAVAAQSAARLEAERLCHEAEGLELRATEGESRAADLELLGKDAPVREQALKGHDVAVLQKEFARLGSTEVLAEQEQQSCQQALETASNALAKMDVDMAAAEADARNVAEQLRQAREAMDINFGSLNGEEPSGLLANADRTLEELQAQFEALEVELRAVIKQRDTKVAGADQQRAEAAARLEAAQAAELDGRKLLAEAQNAFAKADGELGVMRERSEKDDLPGALQLLQAREAEVAEVAASGALATDERVADVERELREHDVKIDNVRQFLNEAEGALRQVGGITLRDEIADLGQARERAEARERDLNIQAEAWQLLRDSLRESEDAEGAHLGRALSEPVTERFVDLTARRYGALSLGPALTTQGVSVRGTTATPDSILAAREDPYQDSCLHVRRKSPKTMCRQIAASIGDATTAYDKRYLRSN